MVHCHSIILLVYLIYNFSRVSFLIAIFISLRLILLVLTLILFLEFALECKECYESKAESAFHHRTIHVKQGEEEAFNKTLLRTIDEAQDTPQ